MRVACIDIGSNTTRLLVADVVSGRVEGVAADRAFTRIGAGLAARRTVTEEKVAEVAHVVARQRAMAEAAGARALRAVGTAAIREAVNGEALCRAVRDRAGLSVAVLAPEEEAALAFRGATWALPAGARDVAVVDVGGGSSEIAVGPVGGAVAWWRSLPVGSGLLAEAHAPGDPPSARVLGAMRADAERAMAALAPPEVRRAVAVGGSATSLRTLVGPELSSAALARSLEVLAGAPAEEVARVLGLDPVRVRLLPAGIVVLAAIGDALGRPLEVGCGGLREGVCLAAAAAAGGESPSRDGHGRGPVAGSVDGP